MGAGDGDFNNGFVFDAGTFSHPTQAAWEFSTALQASKQEQLSSSLRATTIDQKIQGRLEAKALRKQQRTKGKNQAKRQEDSDNDDDSSLSRDSSDNDSEDDQPLPGEIDSGDEDDDEDEDDEGLEAGEEDENDHESDDGEDIGAAGSESIDGISSDIDGQEDDQEELQAGESEDDMSEQSEHSNDEQEPKVKEPTKQQQAKQGKTEKPVANVKHSGDTQQPQQGSDRQKQAANGGAKTAPVQQQNQSNGFYAQTPEGTSFKAASFGDLNLSRPLTRACEALGYQSPTPIQAAVIPLALAGRDICGSAVTGSGKTAAFTLPCLERLLHRSKQIAATYVVVLTPTRELAVQIHSMTTKLAQFTDISAALVVGGLSLQVQATVLRRSPEIVVATPGRLIDHLRNTQSVGLEDLAVLVLDEADRLLEMGFKEEITEIVRMAPRKRQTMLFSATLNDEVRQLMTLSLKQPVRLAADAAAAVPRDLKQEIVRLKGAAIAQKEACLLALCARTYRSGHAIIFFKTKQRAHRTKILFGLLGLPLAAELHGDMTQSARLESLEAFRSGKAAFLLATDVAARGLDIQGVQVVLNYDAPKKLETHLHRIGRTARAGAAGVAVTFVEDDDRALLKEIIKKTKAVMAQRVVPPAAVTTWQSRIEGAAGDVAKVIAEEREEREIRKAEMEATKMQNMLDHEDEIKSRPARTWFQTERQKKETAKRAARAAAGEDVSDDEGSQAKAKAQAKQEAKNKRREKRKLEAAATGQDAKKRKDALQEETGEYTRQIKSAKSKLRALREQGLSAAKAARILGAQAVGAKSKNSSKSKKDSKSKLFSGDGTGRAAAGGGAEGDSKDGAAATKYVRDRSGMSKTELNRIKRGGVGKKAFKSKAKFKRKK